jgi:hypothetical protein
MTSIDAGENAILRFSLKDASEVPIPTDDIKSFIVQCKVGGKVIQDWRYLTGKDLPEGMKITGEGQFTIELLASSTAGVEGVIEVTMIPTIDNPDYVDTAGQTEVIVNRDTLTIAAP